MQFAYLQRDATLCAPNDTFSVAARRIVCQHWQDEADKAESETAVTEEEGGRSRGRGSK